LITEILLDKSSNINIHILEAAQPRKEWTIGNRKNNRKIYEVQVSDSDSV